MVVLLAALGATPGCGPDGECLPELPRDCSPLYDPTYDELFSRRLVMTCGASSTGRSCHASTGAQAGLVFEDPDVSYDLLLGTGGGRARVMAGNPECSLLMQRLESTDPAYGMPPGSRLSDAELCSFTLWIANGAER